MAKKQINFSLPASPEFSRLIRYMGKEIFTFVGFSKDWAARLELVMDELFMNASRYGSKVGESMIYFSFEYDKEGIVFTIEDEGAGPKKITAEELHAIVVKNASNPDPTRTSGRGLAFISSLWTDSLEIKNGPRGGILVVCDKKIDDSVPAAIPSFFDPKKFSATTQASPVAEMFPPASPSAAPAPTSPAPPSLPKGPTFTIKVNGTTDNMNMSNVVDPIARQVNALPEGGVLMLDFAQVSYINSTFIGNLAAWYNAVQAKKAYIVLRNINGQIKDVLDLVGLTKIINVE